MEVRRHRQGVLGVPRLDDLGPEPGLAHLTPQDEEPVELGHATG
jgi:hypothetical protein